MNIYGIYDEEEKEQCIRVRTSGGDNKIHRNNSKEVQCSNNKRLFSKRKIQNILFIQGGIMRDKEFIEKLIVHIEESKKQAVTSGNNNLPPMEEWEKEDLKKFIEKLDKGEFEK